ncbi:hypothetical protein Tco_0501649 [Tanacetum coccineum]
MVQVENPPLTFDELMSTLIRFSSFAMNRLKFNKMTREDLVCPVFNLLKVEKRSGYGYLKEIVVRRADKKLHKFKEGDFLDLHVNDIEDMILLIAQNKLFNLDGDVTMDFVIALKMFIRGIIVKNNVEDMPLGVESYQRKLNLTKPQRTCQHISVKEPYTPNYDLPGIIYEYKSKKKRLMCVDEIHKF